MTDAERGEIARSPSPGADDIARGLALLRGQDAQQLDPVHCRYLAALARRLPAQRGDVRDLLAAKLAVALAAYARRLREAQAEAQHTLARAGARFPQAADDLQRLAAAGDRRGLSRRIADLQREAARQSPLAELTAHLAQLAAADGEACSSTAPGAPRELKAIRQSRSTWSKLCADKALTRAIEEAPENAGPLNSQRLVLSSLALMRDISPDYLERFMAYADTLLAVDQAAQAKKPPATKTPASSARGRRR